MADYKPSVRNVICTAQEYLTFAENCPQFNAASGVAANAQTLRDQITAYNTDIQQGRGQAPTQAAFEDKHSKALVQLLRTSAQLVQSASVNPQLKDFVVEDGGGSEWNRVNPLKLSNHLKDLLAAEIKGVSRSPSAYHSHGPMEYEAHGGMGKLKIRTPQQTLTDPPPFKQGAQPAVANAFKR
jgi:hypothetical protein